jgi:hypothetical protein
MSYQVMAFMFGLAGTAGLLVFFGLYATIVKIAEKRILEANPSSDPDVAELPEPDIVIDEPTEAPAMTSAQDSDQPVFYKGRWFGSLPMAAAFLREKEDDVRFATSEVSHAGHSLWDPNGHFSVAIQHRCLPLNNGARLFVSDYQSHVSKGYVLRGRKRIPIDTTVRSGPSGDAQLLSLAQA